MRFDPSPHPSPHGERHGFPNVLNLQGVPAFLPRCGIPDFVGFWLALFLNSRARQKASSSGAHAPCTGSPTDGLDGLKGQVCPLGNPPKTGRVEPAKAGSESPAPNRRPDARMPIRPLAFSPTVRGDGQDGEPSDSPLGKGRDAPGVGDAVSRRLARRDPF